MVRCQGKGGRNTFSSYIEVQRDVEQLEPSCTWLLLFLIMFECFCKNIQRIHVFKGFFRKA